MSSSEDIFIPIIEHVSTESIKRWLKSKNLTHSIPKGKSISDRLYEHVEKTNLSIDEIRNAMMAIEENAGKRVHLFNSSGHISDPNRLTAHIKSLYPGFSSDPLHVLRNNANSRINYAMISQDSVRIKLSESHWEMESKFDPEHPTQPQTVTFQKIKYVIIILSFTSEVIQIHLDAPGVFHSHTARSGKPTEKAYLQHYVDEATSLLGGMALTPIDMTLIMRRIQQSDKVRIPKESGVGGFRYSHSTKRKEEDLRDYPDHAQNTQNSTLSELQFYWKKDKSNGILNDDLFTSINYNTGMIKFYKDCLPSEVEYAISEIRALKSRAPLP